MFNEIAEAAEKCHRSPTARLSLELRAYREPEERQQNQFIVMLKPELLRSGVDVRAAVRLILERVSSFGVQVGAASVFSAEELRARKMIEEHYWILNRISHNGTDAVAPSAQHRLEEFVREKGLQRAQVVGAYQFLATNADFSHRALETLCRNTETVKLGNGTYANSVTVDGAPLVLLNAFHPRQLDHFYVPGYAVAVIECTSSRTIHDLRKNLIGATDPGDSNANTVKRLLLDHAQELKLGPVSIGFNGIHISPGPVDGMLAISRYFSTPSKPIPVTRTAFGALLQEAGWSEAAILALRERNIATAGGLESPVVEVTEDMNWDETLKLLRASALAPATAPVS